MLAAPVLATALTALMLARGEAALWSLAAWLRPLVRQSTVTALPPVGITLAAKQDPLPLLTQYLVTLVPLRGPPVPASFQNRT